jgi:hypothetical protein
MTERHVPDYNPAFARRTCQGEATAINFSEKTADQIFRVFKGLKELQAA